MFPISVSVYVYGIKVRYFREICGILRRDFSAGGIRSDLPAEGKSRKNKLQ